MNEKSYCDATSSGLLHTHSQSMRIFKCFPVYFLTDLHICELLCALSSMLGVGLFDCLILKVLHLEYYDNSI